MIVVVYVLRIMFFIFILLALFIIQYIVFQKILISYHSLVLENIQLIVFSVKVESNCYGRAVCNFQKAVTYCNIPHR